MAGHAAFNLVTMPTEPFRLDVTSTFDQQSYPGPPKTEVLTEKPFPVTLKH